MIMENKENTFKKDTLEEELFFNEETGDWETRIVDTQTLKDFKEQQKQINLNLSKNDIFVFKDEIESKRVLKDTLTVEFDDIPIGIENLSLQDKRLYEDFLQKKNNIKHFKKRNGRVPLLISEKQIRYSMENSISITEAANFLKVSRVAWTKYAKMYIDPIENKSLYEIFMLKSWGVSSGKNLVFTKEFKTILRTKKELSKMIDPETNKYISKYESANVVKKRKIRMHDVLQGLHPTYDPVRLKRQLFKIGWLKRECENCGFCVTRKDNDYIPLILNFKDGNKQNHRRENLQVLCFNCFFINSPLYNNRYYYRF
jgi:hypothetical protein